MHLGSTGIGNSEGLSFATTQGDPFLDEGVVQEGL